LKRVLRVRALREDLSRMEAEAEASRLREIDSAAAQAADEARASRELSFWKMQDPIQNLRLGGEASGFGSGTPDEEAASERAGSAEGEVGREGGEDGNPAEERAGEGWRGAEADWESAVSRRGGWERRRPAQQIRVDRAQGAYLADRRDRLQAETLVAQAAARERVEQARREQQGLDDWFQSRAMRMRNEEKA